MMNRLIGRRLQGKFSMLPSFAAAMAYYFLVSLVPFLIVVTQGVALVFSGNFTPELLVFMRDVLPPESAFRPELIASSINQSSRGLAAASTMLAIWTASGGLSEMTRAVHFLFSDPWHPDTGGWITWLKTFVVLAIWVIAVGTVSFAFVMLPFTQGVLEFFGIGRLFPGALVSAIRYPTAFAILFAAFAVTYVFVPQKSPSWISAAKGAAVAAASWSGVSILFAYMLPKVWHVSVFDGAMSSVLALLVWAYCGAWGVLLGAIVTVRTDEA